MNITDVDASKIRFNLGDLINQVYYGDAQIRINRRKRPMARLVSEPFMEKLSKFIGYIIENEPALADTLAVMLDTDIRQAMDTSRQEAQNGQTVPLEDILDD